MYIKSVAKKLMEKYPKLFTEDLERNKEIVERIIIGGSPIIKNKIAGYITSVIKSERLRAERELRM